MDLLLIDAYPSLKCGCSFPIVLLSTSSARYAVNHDFRETGHVGVVLKSRSDFELLPSFM